MNRGQSNSAKDVFRELRGMPWSRLWREEVPQFDTASQDERAARVAIIRAVGTVFHESGNADDKAPVQKWLLRLLEDPQEKIRRYAMNAMPKVGTGENE